MKKIVCLCMILMIFLVGCSNSLDSENSSSLDFEIPYDLNLKNSESDYTIVSISADYPEYTTADEIANAAANIYVGKVKEISYEIIDMQTAKAVDSIELTDISPMLYTVYTIEIVNTLKGEDSVEIELAVLGGIEGFDESEQYSKLESFGMLDRYKGIPVVSDKKAVLGLNEEYLFCVRRSSGDYDLVINLTQFAHRIDSENATAIIEALK